MTYLHKSLDKRHQREMDKKKAAQKVIRHVRRFTAAQPNENEGELKDNFNRQH